MGKNVLPDHTGIQWQFWTEWTQKLRACLLRWEGPEVGVWYLSFLGHIHFPGQKELCS